MTKRYKIELDPSPFDEEEKDIIDAFEKGIDEETLVSELTPERRSEIEDSARVTMGLNAETAAALEVDLTKAQRFSSVDELMADLKSDKE